MYVGKSTPVVGIQDFGSASLTGLTRIRWQIVKEANIVITDVTHIQITPERSCDGEFPAALTVNVVGILVRQCHNDCCQTTERTELFFERHTHPILPKDIPFITALSIEM